MSSVPLSLGWDSSHGSQLFKHEFRSKAAVETYFNGLGGANTVVFYGVEGTDYEFHADHGFRTKTNSGAVEIRLSNILTVVDIEKYMAMNGFTLHFDVRTSEWCEPDNSSYLFPIPDLIGTAIPANQTIFEMRTNTNDRALLIRALIDLAFVAGGRSMMGINLGTTSGNGQTRYGRPISMYNKSDYSTIQIRKDASTGQGWFDCIPFVPPHGSVTGSTDNGPGGLHLTASAQKIIPHTTGNFSLWFGNAAVSLGNACTRWVRNIRFFTAPISGTTHPALAQVHSFGDSFTFNTLGPQGASATANYVGTIAAPGSMLTGEFADIDAVLQFCKRLAKRGLVPGGCYGGGQGARAFYTTLDTEGWRAQLINYHPTLVFTCGMKNDIDLIAAATMTIAQLKTKIFDTYILPVMQRGCHGWGWVIPSFGQAATASQITAHADVANMLLAFPADWDIAYPQYAGKVKVKDVRATMGYNGVSFISSKYWIYYFDNAEQVHPSMYGQALFGEKYAEMALEFMGA